MDTFPSWRYGPDGQAKICATADDVPEGWADHPAAFSEPAPTPAPEVAPDAPATLEPEPKPAPSRKPAARRRRIK